MSDFIEPEPNVESEPVADIVLTENENGIVQTEQLPVIPKINTKNDFVRPIKRSDISKIYKELQNIKQNKIKWDEISLGITTLGLGATLSALLSGLSLTDNLGILFYIVVPLISMGTLIFTIMYKIFIAKTSNNSATTIQSIIDIYFNKDELEDKL